MKENVLLLCMSPFKGENSGEKNQYIYEDQIIVNGYYTNEAPAKAIIQKLANKGETLDRIVMICSDEVNTALIKKSSKELDEEIPGIRKMNTREYFEYVIKKYSKEVQKKEVDIPEPIRIPDDPIETSISKATIEAAELITANEDDTDLYIDFNGGPRYVAFMLHAISILMKTRNVNVCQVLTMKFEKNKPTLIQNMSSIFSTVELISGINEYINYGHINGIQGYFKESNSQTICNLLNEMKAFAQNMQLCRTDYIMENKGKLLNDLNTYIREETDRTEKDTYEELFLFVINDIITGYRGLLDGELPDMIRWCVDHDMIQQALTFCSEQMPQYFWDKKLFRATAAEEKEYRLYIKTLLDNRNDLKGKDKTISQEITRYERIGSYGSPYDWMISFLIHSAKNINSLLRVLPQIDSIFQLSGQMQRLNSAYRPKEFRWISSMKVQLLNNTTNASLSTEYARKTKRVDCSGIDQQQKLPEMIYTYYALKEQRNYANHASDGGEAWDYEILKTVIKDYAEKLTEMNKSKESMK